MRGAILACPVHVRGRWPYVSDYHATQGDGELSGIAIDHRATVFLDVNATKDCSFARPEFDAEGFLTTIGGAPSREDASRITHCEPVCEMSADYRFDKIDAYMLLLNQAGRIGPGNMVDPKVTEGASSLEKYPFS